LIGWNQNIVKNINYGSRGRRELAEQITDGAEIWNTLMYLSPESR
jgi:hypothetical protein